jgi:hypothetical protein
MPDPPLHDPAAVAALIDPSIFTIGHYPVKVETNSEYCDGRTLVDTKALTDWPRNLGVATDIDSDAFWDMIGWIEDVINSSNPVTALEDSGFWDNPINKGWTDFGDNMGWWGSGGDFVVDQPTVLGVGERGPEHVTVNPLTGPNKNKYGKSGASQIVQNININISGPVYGVDDLNSIITDAIRRANRGAA